MQISMWQSGTPRLQTNFYSNFTPWEVDPTVFDHPRLCIPLGGTAKPASSSELSRLFGVEGRLTSAYMRLEVYEAAFIGEGVRSTDVTESARA